jgi:hypothetical protein
VAAATVGAAAAAQADAAVEAASASIAANGMATDVAAAGAVAAGAAIMAAVDVAAVCEAADGAAGWAAADDLRAARLFSFQASRRLLSFSLLLLLGGCFLARLRTVGVDGERAVAAADLPLQLKLNSSSPCLVSSVNRAHLPSTTQLLYTFKSRKNGGEECGTAGDGGGCGVLPL